MSEEKRQPKTKEELNALKEKEVETVSKKLHKLTDEELAQVSGGMDIGKVPPIEGLSSLSLPDMVAELEKRGLGNTNPLSNLTNVDTINRPPTPPSPVAESVKKAVDAALQNW